MEGKQETPAWVEIIDGNIAVLQGDEFISKWVKQHKRLDHDESFFGALGYLMKPDSVIVEVGAMIGDHTVLMSQLVGPGGRIHSFEANPRSFWCLQHNTHGLENVRIHNIALGENKSTAGYSENDTNPGAGHLNFGTGQSIAILPLDSFNLAPTMIIADIEGFELYMLRGARKTITKHKPIIVLEINEGALNRYGLTPDMVFAELMGMGYSKIENIYPGESIVGPQFDIVCFPD